MTILEDKMIVHIKDSKSVFLISLIVSIADVSMPSVRLVNVPISYLSN